MRSTTPVLGLLLVAVCDDATAALVNPTARSRIEVSRAIPGDHLLSRRLSQLAVEAFYGQHSVWDGPMARLQRGILTQDVMDDCERRLGYYEEARNGDLPHIGAVFIARDVETEQVIGFADIGVVLYNTRKGNFRLPKRPEGDWGPKPFEYEEPTVRPSHLSPRLYLSNLAVDERFRRHGVGRQLVSACEMEARQWSHGEHAELSPEMPVFLEVSQDNAPARDFYRRLGYEGVAETQGREVVRKRWSYGSETVRRVVMAKALATADEAAAQTGAQLERRQASSGLGLKSDNASL